MSRRRAELSLVERVRSTIAGRRLLDAGDAIVVAVSGGPDSLALLHVLSELSAEQAWRLVVAHLHHGMRHEADADAAFVAGIAERLGHACVVERSDVAERAREEGGSIEVAGRAARYAL